MKAFILILFSILCLHDLSAQKNDTVSGLDKEINADTNDVETMTLDELHSFMKPYPEAFKHIQFAKESHVFTTVFSCVSGFSFGFTLGYFFFRHEILWPPLAVGGASLGMALLFQSRTNNQIRKGIDAYNSRNDKVSRWNNGVSLGVGFTSNGFGVVLRL